jgi:hypothetical protein
MTTADTMREFWVSSGHQLARRAEGGGLTATDELLQAYLARPELAPPPEACAAERALHARLMQTPRAAVAPADLAALADADARENWGFLLRFRDLLFGAPTIEAAYLRLMRGPVDLPPIFVDHLAHLILRNAMDGVDDPFALRAGELFFRPQQASLVEGALTLADVETVETMGRPVSPLQAMLAGAPPSLDVMTADNAWTYWSRSDAFAMALPIGAEPRARAGLAAALTRWIAHLTGLRARIEPVARFDAKDWRWFVGLDAEGAKLGDRLWRGETLTQAESGRIVCLFSATLDPDPRLDGERAGRPFPMILGMSAANAFRLKPQNAIFGLPWAKGAGPQ